MNYLIENQLEKIRELCFEHKVSTFTSLVLQSLMHSQKKAILIF